MQKIGILLTNTGTPTAATARAVRCYLRQFLSDKRIVHLPRLLWLPLLYGLILPFRSHRSAKLYQAIWTPHGSPMRITMQTIRTELEKAFCNQSPHSIEIEIGMNYGEPSIPEALDKLQQKKINKLIALPLFPQYSNSTTASSFDRLQEALKDWSVLPELHFIRDYAAHPDYIAALANSIQSKWQTQPPSEHLLISFHGLPKRFLKKGDPYALQCEQTAHLLAAKLNLPQEKWTACYQSKFGYDAWLQPSTQALLTELPQRGIKTVDVICPGFSVDCLETLEEIAQSGQKIFLAAGGKSLCYFPALNENAEHIHLFMQLISSSGQ